MMLGPKKPVKAGADATASISPKRRIQADTVRMKHDLAHKDIDAAGAALAENDARRTGGGPLADRLGRMYESTSRDRDALRDSIGRARGGDPLAPHNEPALRKAGLHPLGDHYDGDGDEPEMHWTDAQWNEMDEAMARRHERPDDDSFLAGTIQHNTITRHNDGTADTVRGPVMPARAHRIPSEQVFDDAIRRRSKGGR